MKKILLIISLLLFASVVKADLTGKQVFCESNQPNDLEKGGWVGFTFKSDYDVEILRFRYVDGAWECSTHHTPDDESFWNSAIKCRAEQWTPGVGNTRSDYRCQYKVANGWFDSKDPQLQKEVEAA